jgi:hypothetical protein
MTYKKNKKIQYCPKRTVAVVAGDVSFGLARCAVSVELSTGGLT